LFDRVKLDESISSFVKRVFDIELDIEGGFGYEKSDATIINDLKGDSLDQYVYNLAHMRSYLEMNILKDKESRYSSINLIQRSKTNKDGYTIYSYDIQAMLESDYTKFIDEYKDGYGKDWFDIQDHFKRREEATLKREVVYWVKS